MNATFYVQGEGDEGWDIPCLHCGRVEREHWHREDGMMQCAIQTTASAPTGQMTAGATIAASRVAPQGGET